MKKLLAVILALYSTSAEGINKFSPYECQDVCTIETENDIFVFVRIDNASLEEQSCVIYNDEVEHTFIVPPYTISRSYRLDNREWDWSCIPEIR